MLIKSVNGYELEKEKKNTSEDFFNRSEVSFVINKEERTLRVLYVRYFDEIFPELTTFKEDPLLTIGEKSYEFKDIVALVCLLSKAEYRNRKRVYINDQEEFASLFENINIDQLFEILRSLAEKGSYKISPSFTLTA